MVTCFAAALAATPAAGDPSIASKQAEAQSVMSQVQQLDSSLERAVEAYNLATVKLNRVRADLKANHVQLQIAKESLRRAQASLSARLVSLYTSDGQSDSLSVLLGASSLDDLVNRFNTANRISAQDSHVLGQVTRFDNEVKAQEIRLKHAKAEADALVRERASERASIEGQLSARRALLSSIRGEIAHLKAQEAARQAQLRRGATQVGEGNRAVRPAAGGLLQSAGRTVGRSDGGFGKDATSSGAREDRRGDGSRRRRQNLTARHCPTVRRSDRPAAHQNSSRFR